MTKRKTLKKVLGLIAILVLLGLLALFVLSGDNFDLFRSLFLEEHTEDELRDKLNDFGIRGYITIIILSMIQVVVTVMPAEPVQVLAGITFGFPLGLLLCTIGVALGNTAVYLLYKSYGDSIREYFVKNLHFDFERAAKSKRVTFIIFILYFLPAIPYGMICFFSSSIGMKYPRYITVTLLGAIPSVCIGVGLGHMAIASSWILSVIVFSVLLALIIIAFIKREAIFDKVNASIDKPPYSSKTTVRKYSYIKLAVAYVISRIVLFFRGVRVNYVNNLAGDVEAPSIVLCNHGSFIDFVYAGSLLRRKTPNFIVARLYFYKKIVGNILRAVGCFPKSMFASDIESAKNCLRVLKTGGVLAMMPEARLSTVGKFEDIQEGTFAFIKKAGVPVYSIKICGDYLASPKWGDGIRRGSYVEATLDILFTKGEIDTLSAEEIKERTVDRLSYNEFDFLSGKPKIRYKKKTLAEGLENVLSVCPVCKRKYTIYTKRRTVGCSSCGELTRIDDRYGFTGGVPFANFAEWYEWQSELIKEEIKLDTGYTLSSKVEFCLPSSDGKKMLRHAGEGVCTLSREGLVYEGTRDGEDVVLRFPIETIYRLLFGAGENFEVYVGQTIHYFRPEKRCSSVDWYIASSIIYDEVTNKRIGD